MHFKKLTRAQGIVAALLLAGLQIGIVPAQQTEESSIIQHIDAAVKARFENTLGYTVNERYAVFRNNDENHPVAEMNVKTAYRKESGKTYMVLSQSGSAIIRKFVLGSLLENEANINLPANREGAWFTSANYEMKLEPGPSQPLDGRDCYVLDLNPRRKAPYLIQGKMWVDAKSNTVVQIQGTASKNPSILTGPTEMIRQYLSVNGYAMALHSRAISNSPLFGKTVVTVDYRDYQVQLHPAR
jgi:outer membrane lipoprotein-sorting protein